jgi:hypothetical protein
METRDLLRRLRPLLGSEGAERLGDQLRLADPQTAKLLDVSLRRRLQAATGHTEDEPGLIPLPPEHFHGDIRLGTCFYGKRPFSGFALRAEELIQHAAFFGRSGAGKTNVAFLLLRELARHRLPFLVFDWKKNYRDLVPQPAFRRLAVYTVGRDAAPFFFNPLIPPEGVAPREWLKKLIEIMQHAYFLGEGVAFVLQEVLDGLYRSFGVYEGSGHWPTFRDVLDALRARPVKGREAAWMESALRAVGVLCFGAMDWVLNSGARFPLEKLLDRQAVLELDALTNSDKTFLIESLLLWVHHYRMHQPGREKLRHVILVEEAHHVLLKKKQELIGAEAVTDVILREIREFGEGIVLLDQLPSLISKPALENTFTTICLNLKEKGDVTAASKAMLLESDEVRLLGQLPVGWGVVKLQARWPKPFLVRFPLFHVRKGVVTDDQVRERFLEGLGVEGAAAMMRECMEAVCRLAGGGRGEEPGERAPVLSPEELALLADVREHPTCPVTERYERLGLGPKAGTRLVATLVERGLVRPVTVAVPGSHLRLLEFTESGRTALGLDPAGSDRHGGLEHRYWVDRIARELRDAGLDVEVEAPLGDGRAVDLLVHSGNRRVGVEVETGRSDWRANVAKCLEAGLEAVIVAVTRRDLLTSIASATSHGGRASRVSVVPVARGAEAVSRAWEGRDPS